MSFVLQAAGLLSLCFAAYVGFTSVVSDIQIGLVLTSVIGGLILIGLGRVADEIGRVREKLVGSRTEDRE